MELKSDSTYKIIDGLAGTKLSIFHGRNTPNNAPVVGVAFVCPAIQQGYYVLAMSDKPTTHVELEQLVAKFGCPTPGKPAQARKSACEVGIKEFCDSAK